MLGNLLQTNQQILEHGINIEIEEPLNVIIPEKKSKTTKDELTVIQQLIMTMTTEVKRNNDTLSTKLKKNNERLSEVETRLNQLCLGRNNFNNQHKILSLVENKNLKSDVLVLLHLTSLHQFTQARITKV